MSDKVQHDVSQAQDDGMMCGSYRFVGSGDYIDPKVAECTEKDPSVQTNSVENVTWDNVVQLRFEFSDQQTESGVEHKCSIWAGDQRLGSAIEKTNENAFHHAVQTTLLSLKES